jgi:putative oxidoreductase
MLTKEKTQERTEGKDYRSLLVKPVADGSTGLLILRLVLGIIFIAHGGQKVFGWWGGYGLEGTVGFMATLGVPKVLAYIASFTEFFGGVAVLLGLLTRAGALGLAITMLVAIFKVHLPAGLFAPNGYELPLALAAIAAGLILTGPGKYSIDQILARRK